MWTPRRGRSNSEGGRRKGCPGFRENPVHPWLKTGSLLRRTRIRGRGRERGRFKSRASRETPTLNPQPSTFNQCIKPGWHGGCECAPERRRRQSALARREVEDDNEDEDDLEISSGCSCCCHSSDRLGFYLSIDIFDLNRQAEEHMDFPR